MTPLPWGDALFSPQTPRWYDANVVRVTEAGADISAETLAAVVDRLQGDLPHRRLEVWDYDVAERLQPRLEISGWDTDVLLLMRATARTGGRRRGVTVESGTYADVWALREEWLRGDPLCADDDLIAQARVADGRLFSANPSLTFCVRGPDRTPVAMAHLLGGRGGIAMIEDVYVTPSRRGEGLGAAVVLAAVAEGRASGCRFVYLPTDFYGHAARFYRALGFEDLGGVVRFLRTTASTAR